MRYCRSNNTNKFSPQELFSMRQLKQASSNNTNKFSPQERSMPICWIISSSNNTNKFSPQEHGANLLRKIFVQIIQINLVLKNRK